MKQLPDRYSQGMVLNDAGESANAIASIVQASDPQQSWVIDWIAWSYSGTPTGGRLTVAYGDTVILDHDITAGGPGILRFDHGEIYHTVNFQQQYNEGLAIALYAGGAGVTGKLTARIR